MDYLLVGSNGFAQVGTPDFCLKNEIEMKYLLEHLKTNYAIPEEFAGMCFYKEKWFRHDFGNYSEIVLMYNDRMLYSWDNDEPEKFNRFWEWFNDLEAVNLESEFLNREIKNRYCEFVKSKVS